MPRTPYKDMAEEIMAMEPGDTLIWDVANTKTAQALLSRYAKDLPRRYVFHPACANSCPGQLLAWYPKAGQ